ncbi:hypothetical protein IAT38_007947 [Cryptococcus sp. DSM 104549]
MGDDQQHQPQQRLKRRPIAPRMYPSSSLQGADRADDAALGHESPGGLALPPSKRVRLLDGGLPDDLSQATATASGTETSTKAPSALKDDPGKPGSEKMKEAGKQRGAEMSSEASAKAKAAVASRKKGLFTGITMFMESKTRFTTQQPHSALATAWQHRSAAVLSSAASCDDLASVTDTEAYSRAGINPRSIPSAICDGGGFTRKLSSSCTPRQTTAFASQTAPVINTDEDFLKLDIYSELIETTHILSIYRQSFIDALSGSSVPVDNFDVAMKLLEEAKAERKEDY